jgi:hypothetical protein
VPLLAYIHRCRLALRQKGCRPWHALIVSLVPRTPRPDCGLGVREAQRSTGRLGPGLAMGRQREAPWSPCSRSQAVHEFTTANPARAESIARLTDCHASPAERGASAAADVPRGTISMARSQPVGTDPSVGCPAEATPPRDARMLRIQGGRGCVILSCPAIWGCTRASDEPLCVHGH